MNIDTGILESPTIYFHQFFILLLLPILIWKYKVLPKWLVTLVLTFFVIGCWQVATGNSPAGLFFKTYTGVVITVIFFFYIIKYYDYNVEDIFRVYVWGCMLTSIVFLIQIVSYKIGFRYGYDLSYLGIRFTIDPNDGFLPAGLAHEPSGISILGPAMMVSLYNLIMRKQYLINYWQSLIILLVGIMSSSSTVYFSLLVGIIIITLSLRGIMVIVTSIAICIASFSILYTTIEKFRDRFDDSVELFVKRTVSHDDVGKFNVSAVVLYHHYIIAVENIKAHPLFGTGIGSHAAAFDRYSPFDESVDWYFLNRADANSLFLRLMSETGLVGLAMFFYFLFHFRLRREKVQRIENWLINQSVMVLIFANLLRGGNYMSSAFPLFLLLYYYSYRAEHGPEVETTPAGSMAIS